MLESSSKTIDQHQAEIVDTFAALYGDRSAMLDYLIDLGATLPPLDLAYKTDSYLVKGCMSKVWLRDKEINGLLLLEADSNTVITKGLISLLIKVLSAQPIEAVVKVKLYFVEAIGMNELIGFQRASGLAHMIKEIKIKALYRSLQATQK